MTNTLLPSDTPLMQAMDHFNSRRFSQARELCRQALLQDPQNGDYLMLLGSIAVAEGDLPLACDHYLQAATAAPDSFLGSLAMGFYLRHTGKPQEAVACFRQATVLAPDDPTPWTLLSETLLTLGRSAEADECQMRLRQIGVRLSSPTASARPVSSARVPTQRRQFRSTSLNELMFLAQSLYKQTRITEALNVYRQALALQPTSSLAQHGVGLCLVDQNNHEEALPFLKKAVEYAPNNPLPRHDLVNALIKQRHYEEAERHARRLIQLAPNRAYPHMDLGLALTYQLRFEEAGIALRRALELDPKDPQVYNNFGTLSGFSGDAEAAALYYQRALELNPDLPECRANLGLITLMQGDFEHGWHQWEARLRTREFASLNKPHLFWDGSSLVDKTIMVQAEQGHGDTIHFVRYLPLLKAQGAHIKFVGTDPLHGLLSSLGCIDEWMDVHAEEHKIQTDFFAPLMSLPSMFGTRLDTIPADVPYLAPPADLNERWRNRLASYGGYRVGIVWAGNPDFVRDRERSCHVRRFLPLFDIPGITLFSLQKGEAAVAQIAELPAERRPVDLADQLKTFEDTAAAIVNLDLVISVDTSVAHLAGALAQRVWTLLPYAPDWRWLLHRSDSPWYPTMRLFRQPALRDWDSVFQYVTAALTAETKDRINNTGK